MIPPDAPLPGPGLVVPPAVAVGIAFALALATALASGPVLRQLPEPLDDPDVASKTPYAALAGPGFAAGVFAASLAANLLVVARTPASHWIAWASLTTVSVLACAIDLRTTYLPRVLAVAGWLVAAAGAIVAAATTASVGPLLSAAAGAAALGGFFWVFWRLSRGLGFGDVRLAATIGAVTGLKSLDLVVGSVLLGTLLGAAWSVGRRLARGHDGPFAYGPALLAGPFLALALRWALGG